MPEAAQKLPSYSDQLRAIIAQMAAIAAAHVRIGIDESKQLGVLSKHYYVIKISMRPAIPGGLGLQFRTRDF